MKRCSFSCYVTCIVSHPLLLAMNRKKWKVATSCSEILVRGHTLYSMQLNNKLFPFLAKKKQIPIPVDLESMIEEQQLKRISMEASSTWLNVAKHKRAKKEMLEKRRTAVFTVQETDHSKEIISNLQVSNNKKLILLELM